MKIKIIFLTLVLVLSTLFIAYGRVGMVVKVVSQDEIIVSLGSNDNIQTDDTLLILRLQKPIARGKVTAVLGENSCNVRITEKLSSSIADLGDTVTKDFSSVSTDNPPVSVGEKSPVPDEITSQPVNIKYSPSNNPADDYYSVLAMRTRAIKIETGSKKENTTSDDSDWQYNLATLGLSIMYGDPLYMATTATTMSSDRIDYSNYNNYNYGQPDYGKPVTPPVSKITVVMWDQELFRVYSTYRLSQRTDVNNDMKTKLMQQEIKNRGISTNIVFQVIIDNASHSDMNISPFKDNAYMIDGDGKRYDMIRCDSVFDSTVSQGQKADGYIYFPKICTDRIELHLQNIWQENYTLEWEF
ncbi:MAG: hypothetical protein ABRQ37_15285 [Candidatus Eremiobacterota bacterium]